MSGEQCIRFYLKDELENFISIFPFLVTVYFIEMKYHNLRLLSSIHSQYNLTIAKSL